MPWGTGVVGNGVSQFDHETYMRFPNAGGDPLYANGTMSVGYWSMAAGAVQTVLNTSVINIGPGNYGSFCISIMAVDLQSYADLFISGWWHQWQQNVNGVSFQINVNAACAGGGNFMYWLLHPAR